MQTVSAPQESADATVLYALPGALGFCASAKPVLAAGRRDVRDPDGDTGRAGLRWRSGVAAVGLAGGPRLRERGADKRGILQGAEGGANYGVNPTRLAPQAAAAVRAVEQDF